MSNLRKVFDYQALAEKHNIEPHILKQIIDEARREFAQDEMMVELHVVRAIRSLKSTRKP